MASTLTRDNCKWVMENMTPEQLSEIEQHLWRLRLPTVAAKVFDVPELLEMILLAPNDPQDIIAVMRVSRTFKDMVQSSTKLQRAAFLTHDTNPTVTGRPRVNPGLSCALRDLGFHFKPQYYYLKNPPELCISFKRQEADEEDMNKIEKLATSQKAYSWRPMNITTHPITTTVEFINDRGQGTLVECATFSLVRSEATLGAFWDLGYYVRKRSLPDYAPLFGQRSHQRLSPAFAPGSRAAPICILD